MKKNMKLCLKVAFFALSLIFGNATSGAEVKQSAPKKYTVKKGDTLWDISGMYLEEPWRWPELWVKNTQIENPHLIYPGDVIVLSIIAGQPMLTVERSKAKIVLSPQVKRIDKKEAIDILPWELLAPYIKQSWIVDDSAYQLLPRVLGNGDGDITFANNDFLITRQKGSAQDQYFIVRNRGIITDMEGNELGYQLNHVADAQMVIDDLESEWLVRVTNNLKEVVRGDILWTTDEFNNNDLRLMPAKNVTGSIVAGLNERSMFGKFDVVVVDIGKNKLDPGVVLGIYDQGPTIIDDGEPRYIDEADVALNIFDDETLITQPAIKIGEMVVISVFENASYGFIMRSQKTVKRGFIVAEP